MLRQQRSHFKTAHRPERTKEILRNRPYRHPYISRSYQRVQTYSSAFQKETYCHRIWCAAWPKNPIVFALANPTPEISYEDAMASRPDVLMATGRSDYPNQINNVIGFPYIFRGALDTRATAINEAMKLAAVRAIAGLAKQPVPDVVNAAYHVNNLTFGRDYFIPKPVDPRLITEVSMAVARAAMESGVARKQITDWDEYRNHLEGTDGTRKQTDPPVI